jgi:hypothetical protein
MRAVDASLSAGYTRAMWKSLQQAFDHDGPIDLGIRIEVTDVLKGRDLKATMIRTWRSV